MHRHDGSVPGMILQCYVDDKTLAALQAFSADDGRSVETLAEDAIAEAVLQATRSLNSKDNCR